MMDTRKALNKAAQICSKKEYCSNDILDKLLKWGISEKDSKTILEELKKNKFIDERRFATSYANDKFRFNKWGKNKIALMLKRKGISSEIIDEALAEIKEDKYVEMCCDLLKNKIKQAKTDDIYKLKASLYRFAASRGFDSETIWKCINKLL